jgi:two-component system KDP operon response regulator KdpE
MTRVTNVFGSLFQDAANPRVDRPSEEGLALAAARGPDLVVLDLGLPDLDGAEVIRRLRGWSDVPVIVLSVRDRQVDKIDALDAGADDYVTKPFDVEELLARMRAALRRATTDREATPILRFADLEIDLSRQLVRRGGGAPPHTHRVGLLEAMTTNPGKPLTHQWLLGKVSGRGYGTESHYLHVYVWQLRYKLGDDAAMHSSSPSPGWDIAGARSRFRRAARSTLPSRACPAGTGRWTGSPAARIEAVA